MRQRTISDHFWRDPDISGLSQEDKATLLYFLTSPSSNIIGCYQVVWMIAAAEMGWTKDQLLVVVERLKAKSLIEFNDDGWVWVKLWWKHNSSSGAFNPSSKLSSHVKKQCAAIPREWLVDFGKSLEAFGINTHAMGYPYPTDAPLMPHQRGIISPSGTPSDAPSVNSETRQPQGLDTPSMPHPCPIEGAFDAPPHGGGGNGSCISNTTTTSSSSLNPVVVNDLIFSNQTPQAERDSIQAVLVSSGVNETFWQALVDELAGARMHRTINNPVGFLRGMAERALAGTFIPERGLIVTQQRRASEAQAQHDAEQIAAFKLSVPSGAEALSKLPPHLRGPVERITAGVAK